MMIQDLVASTTLGRHAMELIEGRGHSMDWESCGSVHTEA